MVFLALLLIMGIVITLLNRGFDRQTRELLSELEIQAVQRVSVGRTILRNTLAKHIQGANDEVANACLDMAVRRPVQNGQWKALFARIANICTKSGIDFMVVFDTNGKVLVSYPAMMEEGYPETHFKKFDLLNSFASVISQRNLTETRIVSFVEKWDSKTHRGYNIDNTAPQNIVAISAGIVPNDYMDEPIGYLMVGLSQKRLSESFTDFFNTTGQISLLMDKQTPLVWAGISGNVKSGIKESNSFRINDNKKADSEANSLYRLEFDGKSYLCNSDLLINYFPSHEMIRVADSASMCRIIVGEPASFIHDASQKIYQEGAAIKHKVLVGSLLISFIVLLITTVFMTVISLNIAKPISMAAQMSDKIASGDLNHKLDESGTVETAMLSRSMNIMAQSLETLKKENETQMRALEESEKQFRTLFNKSHQAIALIEKDTGKLIDVNARLYNISQYNKNEIIGKTAEKFGLCSAEDGTILTEEKDHTDSAREWETEFRIKDGSVINIQVFVEPIKIKTKEFFLIEFYDVTEKKHLESQLKQSLKMESIGTLAGGIAHDFNNILGVILGNTELALGDIKETHPARENLESVKTACLRAAEIVSQLLRFSRKSEQKLNSIDILPVINESLTLLRSSIPSTVHINKKIKGGKFLVLADPVQINQIIMNLCINAYQAMKDAKGTIDVCGEIIEVDEATLRKNKDLKPGKYVQIDISDDGAGIPPNILNRIFDPYFTTKPIEKGTGMGLAMVHGIIKSYMGAITVASTPGRGSRFSIYLPLIRANPIPKSDFQSKNLVHGTESILLVDDDKEILNMFKKMLTQIGYHVEAHTNPLKALDAFKLSSSSFDLVVTDMTMPGMTGAELARRVKDEGNEIPIIICTGHSDFIDPERARNIGVTELAMKPIAFKEFSDIIRHVLDNAIS
jgi:PAS domain S-box-containing protein